MTFLGNARRDGYDLDARYYVIKDPVDSVSLFANFGGVRARLLDAAPSFYVPNVPNYVANVGIDFNVATVNAQTPVRFGLRDLRRQEEPDARMA